MRPERVLRLELQHEVLELVEAAERRHRPGECAGRRAVDPPDPWPEVALPEALQEAELHQHAVDGTAGEDDCDVALHSISLGQDAAPSNETLPARISSIRPSVS